MSVDYKKNNNNEINVLMSSDSEQIIDYNLDYENIKNMIEKIRQADNSKGSGKKEITLVCHVCLLETLVDKNDSKELIKEYDNVIAVGEANELMSKGKDSKAESKLKKVLKKDHPKIVKIVEKYSDVQELKDGTAELIIEILKKKKRKLGRGDKESYEEFWYLGDGRFHYEEGDTLGYGHPHHEEIFQSEEKFKEFLKRRWIQVKDGIITGPGQPTMFIPYWLKDMGLGSIREYIEAQKKK